MKKCNLSLVKCLKNDEWQNSAKFAKNSFWKKIHKSQQKLLHTAFYYVIHNDIHFATKQVTRHFNWISNGFHGYEKSLHFHKEIYLLHSFLTKELVMVYNFSCVRYVSVFSTLWNQIRILHWYVIVIERTTRNSKTQWV